MEFGIREIGIRDTKMVFRNTGVWNSAGGIRNTEFGFRNSDFRDTDSEHLFFYLLSALVSAGVDRTGRTLSESAMVGEVVRNALLDLTNEAVAQGLLRPIINVLLTDGRLFVAMRAGMPLLLSTQKHFCKDFGTCAEPSKVCMEVKRPGNHAVNHLLVASEPIASEENRWEELADGGMIVLDENFLLKIHEPPKNWVIPILPDSA